MWLNRFRRSAPAVAPAPPPSRKAAELAALQVRKERIRTALRDVLRTHHVPSVLLDCEVYFAADAGTPGTLHIHLVMQRWSGKLLRYAMAIERQFSARIAHYEPGIEAVERVFSWRFAAHCNCPFPDMPEAALWQQERTPGKEPLRVLDRRRKARTSDGGVYLHNGSAPGETAQDFVHTTLSHGP